MDGDEDRPKEIKNSIEQLKNLVKKQLLGKELRDQKV